MKPAHMKKNLATRWARDGPGIAEVKKQQNTMVMDENKDNN